MVTIEKQNTQYDFFVKTHRDCLNLRTYPNRRGLAWEKCGKNETELIPLFSENELQFADSMLAAKRQLIELMFEGACLRLAFAQRLLRGQGK